MKIAIIGSGIAGLGTAHALGSGHELTLFEAGPYAGGHTHTVDVTLDGRTSGVDTGFLVYNERTYPRLIALFGSLGIPVARTDMSFAVSVRNGGFEWSGTNLRSLFAQPANALRPRFWRMLRDIRRFNAQATAIALAGDDATDEPIGDFLAREGYDDAFVSDYLMPMAAAIWSCPIATMRAFPVCSFVRFWHNHGLLQVSRRPQWYTVAGGARQYVAQILPRFARVHLDTPVRAVRRAGRPVVVTDAGSEAFDQVVIATHSDQALAMLERPDETTARLLGAIRYQPNRAWLHTDPGLMPRRRSAWAAWNYLGNGDAQAPAVSVTYWLNRLQPLPFETDVFVTLNPIDEPATAHRIDCFDYAHPVFDTAAIAAQRELPAIQGRDGLWFCGAWTRYGFHEDGLASGQQVAALIERHGDALACDPPASRLAA